MAQDSSEIWQEMMANWQAGQQSMTEQMLSSFKQWNDTFTGNKAAATNPILDTYQTIIQAFFKNLFPVNNSGFADDWEKYLSDMPGAEPLVDNIKALMLNGQQLFDQITGGFSAAMKGDESQSYLLKALTDMSNPNSWLKYTGDSFDASAHKLSEGPLFSGISDIDNRMALVSDSWHELFGCSKDYHAIVFARWTKAYSRFIDGLKNLEEDDKINLSPRKMVDMWSAIANEELLDLHRSDEFLNAQRAVIRSSMQYRLHEKNIAEVICDALHIPTRDEVDDLHKSVTELRRELRQTKNTIKQLTRVEETVKPKKKPAKKTQTAKSAAKPKKVKRPSTSKTTDSTPSNKENKH